MTQLARLRWYCAPALALTVMLTGCGGSKSTPTAPTPPAPTPTATPTPLPTSVSVAVTILETLTGANLGTMRTDVARLPAQITVSSPGHVTRLAWVTTAAPSVDLIREQGFDLGFYRQLARNGYEAPTQLQPLRVLTQAPSFYMEVEGARGLSAATAARVERVARRIVPVMTGGRFQVAVWQTGPSARAPQSGWIMIERKDDLAGPDVPATQVVCGRAVVGQAAGQIWLSGEPRCQWDALFAHEIGHALGFWHVDQPGYLMFPREYDGSSPDAPSERERHHAAIAYTRASGNRDVDVDPSQASGASTAAYVVD
jgi:hypothetical protein